MTDPSRRHTQNGGGDGDKRERAHDMAEEGLDKMVEATGRPAKD